MEGKTQLKTENFKLIDRKLEEKDICYVVIKNTTILKWVNHQKQTDEVTQVLKVFKSEEKANEFTQTLKTKMNESVYVIPTLFEDNEEKN